MVLIIRFVRKLTQPAGTAFEAIKTEAAQEQRQMHTLVTSIHVTLILLYTVLSVIAFNVYSASESVAAYRFSTAWFFFGGIQDMFLAFLMFFILNGEVDIIRDESTKINYAVLDVINMDASQHSD
jgi:hypothetical protein